jgi:hypothetical protein
MNTPTRLKELTIFVITFSVSFPMTAIAQTFSPYTPEQIQEFNNQPLAPVETPAGPVYLVSPPVSQKPTVPFDSRYIKNPDGEEQAQAEGAESAAPFEPIPAAFTF